jgi:hypothetical protein
VNGLLPHVVSAWIARAKEKTGGRRSRRPRPGMERPALGRVNLHEIWPGASPSYSRAINTVVSGPCNFWRRGRHELGDACRLRTLKTSNVTPTLGHLSSTGLHHRPAYRSCVGKTEVSGFAQTRSGGAISLRANAAASAHSTKIQICRRDRHSDDRHAGIVLGFCSHLNASFRQRLRRCLDRLAGRE